MRYLGEFEAFIQKPKIFKRYILNVRKPPMKMLSFITTLTDTQKELVVKYIMKLTLKISILTNTTGHYTS